MAVGLGLAERVQQPGVEAPGVVGRRAQAARERVGGGEADAVDLGHRPRVRPQPLDRAGAERARDPPGRRGRDAVLVEEEAHRPLGALRLPRRDRGPQAHRADAGHLAQAPAGVVVELGQHALGPVALDEPRRAARADVLDPGQMRLERRDARRLLQPDPVRHELAPVARVLAPGALDEDGLARLDVRERPGDGDLVALVGDAGEHGEVLAVGPPADRGDLDRQGLPSDDVPRPHVPDGTVRPGAGRGRMRT